MSTPTSQPVGRAVAVVVGFVLIVAVARGVTKEAPIVELPQDRYGKYAAFAELDNKIAKFALGTLTVRVMRSGSGNATDYVDAEQDIESTEAYVDALESMDLTEAERDALRTFKAGWRELVEMNRELTGKDHVSREQLLLYWKKANALEGLTYGVIEAMLADQNYLPE